ncbi:1-deoxy-D-xylulose-5-phosphate reductoisomerase [uncultured Clostridium sp.]|uniref:1-deoxy-D-xylulose-5-phosphate reductoisomerase n=1 Tax=uncultured Clostridium sp. TaxID=59620 RepID=UPI0026201AB0|nr:1-deoxy-D-xylulose-5-phosphate reductoisomerase [uncultured Clostridium sp.]
MKRISILGATGSIGVQTIDVVRKSEDIQIIGITANTSVLKMIEIIDEFNPKYVCMMDNESSGKIKEYVEKKKLNIDVSTGIDGLIKIATLDEIDTVVTSVVGMIGLRPTLEAIRKKKDIALANKETLVVAGEIVMREAKENGVNILPVDSEHSAIFQALQGNKKEEIKKILLTASGGPFRGKDKKFLETVNLKDALNHPNWSMGKKITIDSASLMNKGLEVIEAHFLFDVDYEDIQVVVHPQSIVHSMIEYKDNSIIAQLGSPDMRLPIQYALNYPERKVEIATGLDFYNMVNLTFEKPDMNTFKCLKLAFKAGKRGGLMPTILNGANEEAVALYLDEKIKFLEIGDIIERAIENFKDRIDEELTVENIINLDKDVKEYVRNNF